MIDFRSGRYALGICVAVAMLAGCGGHTISDAVPAIAGPNTFPNHKSFYYTAGAQYFTVPARVRQIKVIARGARGARGTMDRTCRVRRARACRYPGDPGREAGCVHRR